MSNHKSGDLTLPLEALKRIDEVCLKFEEAWKRGKRSQIEDCLGNSEGKELIELLHQLILLDINYRSQNGEKPTRSEYEKRFPEHIEMISGIEFLELHPEHIGHYKILSVLGQGGMGIVYLAEQIEPMRRRVALKVIKLGMDTKEVIARFESERQALALMDHPNIAKVYDAGTTPEGRPYFVMEYVPGIPISEHCDRHRLSTRERLDLFTQVCEAVQHAHHKAIIHRDIKPSNILVSVQGEKPIPKIIDFGVAKATNQRLTEKTFFTAHGQIIGTPAYMSPEQADLTSQDVDTRTDIYSLGVLLYELLVGVLPFDEKSLREAGFAEIQRIIREEDPPKPSTRLSGLGKETTVAATKRRTYPRHLVRELRGDLDWITLKALEKDRSRRYATAGGLAEDIRRHLDHDPVLAGPPGILYRLGKLCRKYPGRLAAILAALLFAAILVGQAWYFQTKERNEGIRRSRVLLIEARKDWNSYLQVKSVAEIHQRELRDVQDRYEFWRPVWEREEEIKRREELREANEHLDQLYNQVMSSLFAAHQIAPTGTRERDEIREELAKVFYSQYERAKQEGQVAFSPEFFASLVRSQQVDFYNERLTGSTRILLQTNPPGAEVYCFRYESYEERLVPIPFNPLIGFKNPAEGLLGKPFLEVENVWDSQASPFETGDRLFQVGAKEVSFFGEFAKALTRIVEGQSVEVKVLRKSMTISLSWVPFPKGRYDPERLRKDKTEAVLMPGRVVDILDQFGFTFAGYPLDMQRTPCVGITREDSSLAIDLPKGSYLFVIRKAGFRDTRFPVAIPGEAETVEIQLLKDEEIPTGFIYIPGGTFPYGGDQYAFQSLECGTATIKSFLMKRTEVTFEEYLEFVNYPEICSRIDDNGKAKPFSNYESEKWISPSSDGFIKLIPEDGKLKPIFEKKEINHSSKWVLRSSMGNSNWPLFGVSTMAALEYARWLTRKNGNRFQYRLPTDFEWEWASRGSDLRTFVWGNHLCFSFCNSNLANYSKNSLPALVGTHPLDESIFGVRDMAGSVSEFTCERAIKRLPFTVYRGGSWHVVDEYFFHSATRNSRLPWNTGVDTGIRLVAEFKER